VLTVAQKLNVKNIIISKQNIQTLECINLMQICKDNKINVIQINDEKSLKIDKDTYVHFLSPCKDISFEDINENSIVCKLVYKDFSMLFTGDIGEQTEAKLLKKYKNGELKANVLKVAHHGAKTSSSLEFLKEVSPKIALIGVGENSYGHPNEETLNKLESLQTKIYRTDFDGEIMIKYFLRNSIEVTMNNCQ